MERLASISRVGNPASSRRGDRRGASLRPRGDRSVAANRSPFRADSRMAPSSAPPIFPDQPAKHECVCPSSSDGREFDRSNPSRRRTTIGVRWSSGSRRPSPGCRSTPRAVPGAGPTGRTPADLPSWLDEIRAAELDDAARRSIERRRAVTLEYQEVSEDVGFKGTMTLVGCGLIWFIPVLLILSRSGSRTSAG